MKNTFFVFFMQKSKVWCWKPNIYELFLRCWTYTWDAWCWKPIFRENVAKTLFFFSKIPSLVLETQHLRIIFEVLDLHLGCLVLEANFPRKGSKNIDFYTVWEPAWYTKPDPPDPPDAANPPDPAEMVHSWQFAP